MDAMDVLGALLGRKAGSGSSGGNVLKDILGGGQRPAPQRPSPQRQSPPPQRRTSPPSQHNHPRSIGDAARSLEDLLNVSNSRHNERRQAPPAPSPPAPSPRAPAPPTQRAPAQHAPQPQSYEAPSSAETELNEQSAVLVRAMIGAAKADGQITQDEQQEIINQLGHVTESTLDFLRREFARSTDVKDLAWSVPLGMEEQAYAISLIAIDLDENKEAHYLADLAHGLRLQPSRCNDLHRKYGAPVIFQE